jgi:hypothetical protein
LTSVTTNQALRGAVLQTATANQLRLFDATNFTGKGLADKFVGHLSFACRVCYLFRVITGFMGDSRFRGQYPMESGEWEAIEKKASIASSRAANIHQHKNYKNFIPGLLCPKVST